VQNPTEITDLELRFRPLTEAEKTTAEAWLVDAWEELQARVPALQARYDAGLVTDGLIRRVVAAMVVRVLKNPDSLRSWTVDGDSFTRDSVVSAGLLFVSADEIELLNGVSQSTSQHFSFSAKYQ